MYCLFLVFMPFMPLALLACIVAGAGFLIFAPFALFIIHLEKIKEGFGNLWSSRRKAILVFSLSFLALPFVYTTGALLDKVFLNQALSYVYEPDYTGVQRYTGSRFFLRRSLKRLEDFKEGIYLPFISPYYNWLVFNGLVLLDEKVKHVKHLFFGEERKTKKENKPHSLFGFNSSFKRTNKQMHSLNGLFPKLDNKSLNLTYEVIKSSNSQNPPEGFEKTLIKFRVKNTSSQTLEYNSYLELPKAAFVSGLWLYIDGKRQRGNIFEKKSAEWVYQMITAERRDPALLSFVKPNLLSFKLFPCLPREERTFEIELIHPIASPENIKFAGKAISLNQTQKYKKENYFYEGSNFVFLKDKKNVKSFKRQPYLHLIIEKSRNSKLSDLKSRIQRIRQLFPNAQETVYTIANYETSSNGFSRLVFLEQLEKQLDDPNSSFNEENNSLKARGGFAQERFIKVAILNSAQHTKFVENCNAKLSDWELSHYPVIVVLRTSNDKPLSDSDSEYDLNYYRDLLPDYPIFHIDHPDGNFQSFDLDGSAYIGMPVSIPVIAFCKVSNFVEPNLSIASYDSEKISLSTNLKNQVELRTIDPKKKEFIPLENLQKISNPNGLYPQALNLWFEYNQLLKNPSLINKSFKKLVIKSKELGVMLPITSYIVLENKAQEEALKRKEKKKLNNKASLEILEANEPPLWIIVFSFLAFVFFAQKKFGLIN
ncbi:MAG: MSEP-CTERM sorting domain-containing protein [Candidatus Caenarcaniphilales bacterium]|nr:MSEP-CTERM sorting domain-containing protein [Candidatus Caenarcaniphilales bacterium]